MIANPRDAPRAMITGATSGIGQACADAFASRGYSLVITSKPEDKRLEQTAIRLRKMFGVAVIESSFDLGDERQCLKALTDLDEILSGVTVLVNNAGIGIGFGLLFKADPRAWSKMIDVNFKGMLHVSKAVGNHMVKKNSGHIINLGSMVGRWPKEGNGAYSATKHAVYALTEAMRMDLFRTKVRVTVVEPGLTRTEFSPPAVYNGITPLESSDIANAIVWAATRPARVNIQEIVLTGKSQYQMRIDRKIMLAEKK